MNGNLANAETGKALMIAQKVKLYVPRFTHYDIKPDKETSVKDYIMGYNKKDTPFEIERLSPQYTDSREILDSLLHLNFIIVNNFKYSRERQYKEIIKWCQKYGLPFQKGIEAVIINDTPVIIQTIRSPYADQGYYTFSAEIFCSELATLYNHFLYILACKPDLYIGIDGGKKIGIDRDRLHDKYIYNLKSSATIEQIQEMLLQYFKEIKFKMDIEFDGERYSLIPTFDNLIELAKYQLLLLYNADTTTGIKECKCCGELFSCTHRSKEFCSRCSPQKYYQRKKRAKQKEGTKNG